jgi:hypothetical protein
MLVNLKELYLFANKLIGGSAPVLSSMTDRLLIQLFFAQVPSLWSWWGIWKI